MSPSVIVKVCRNVKEGLEFERYAANQIFLGNSFFSDTD